MARILVVDNRPTNIGLLTALLCYRSHKVFEAGNGKEALAIARRELPDLIISDILMPEMDGFEFVRELRKDARTASMPVMFLTAEFLVREAMTLAQAVGVTEIVYKPFEAEELLAKVDAMLALSSAPQPDGEFDEQHLRLLTDKLIDTAELLRAANSKLQALVDLTTSLGAERDPPTVLKKLCHSALELFGTRCAVVGLRDRTRDQVPHFVSDGMDENLRARLSERDPGGLFSAMLANPKPRRISGEETRVLALPSLNALLVVPITSSSETYGWLCLAGKIGLAEFTDEDEAIAGNLCALVGRFYERLILMQRLERSEALLRDAVQSIAAGVAIFDDEDRLVMCNDTYRGLFAETGGGIVPGATFADLLRSALAMSQYPDAAGHPQEWLTERLRRHVNAAGAMEERLADGRWVLDAERRMGSGGFAALRIDITALKAAQVARDASELRYRRLFEAAKDGILILDADTAQIVDANPFLIDLLGYSRDEYLGKTLWEIGPFRDVAKSKANFSELQQTAYIRYEDLPLETKGGLKKEVEFVSNSYMVGDRKVIQCNIRDITEAREGHRRQQELEQLLAQAQKMEAIGSLTGGMAHDFNNLLGVIIGNLDLLREHRKDDPEADDMAREALDAALRGADLTHRLLAFARRQPLQPQQVDLNKLVTGIVTLLRRVIGEDITVALEPGQGIWPIIVDPAQLESAITNLATNARDAMPQGGSLTIRTGNRRLDQDYAAMHAEVTAGDYAMLEVSDTGTGMTPEVVGRIFEPFYTTKEQGKGTGLGLSMVYGFVKQSGGHIDVYSEPGIGTTFRLYLPQVRPGVAEAEAAIEQEIPRGQGETVLVVEDNPGVRRIVTRQVSELGYQVLEADNGAAALDLLSRGRVDVLFSDIVMPGALNGIELARLARKRWPQLRTILTSGFPATSGGRVEIDHSLLVKPYRKADLARALRDSR